MTEADFINPLFAAVSVVVVLPLAIQLGISWLLWAAGGES